MTPFAKLVAADVARMKDENRRKNDVERRIASAQHIAATAYERGLSDALTTAKGPEFQYQLERAAREMARFTNEQTQAEFSRFLALCGKRGPRASVRARQDPSTFQIKHVVFQLDAAYFSVAVADFGK